MEIILSQRQSLHFCLRDLDARRIVLLVQPRLDAQTSGSPRSPDEIDDCLKTGQWLAPPVLGDVTEEPMFDLVPLAGSRRKVAHVDVQPRVISQLLQFFLPGTCPVPVAAACICCDEKVRRTRLGWQTHRFPPLSN